MKTIILGAGGHARVVIDALRSAGVEPHGLTDRDENLVGTSIDAVPVIGPDELVEDMKHEEVCLTIGFGNRASNNGPGLAPRRGVYDRFSDLGFGFAPVRHAQAIVSPSAKLNEGVQVMAGAIIQAGARVECNAIINTGALVEHDCFIGGHAHIAPRAVILGGVTIGEESHIGAGCLIHQNRKVGRGAVVAAGAMVFRDIAEGEVFRGGRGE